MKRGMRWIGNCLVGIGLAALLLVGAYYAYSYYSLGQIEQGIDAGFAPDVAASEPQETEVDAQRLASFLSGSPVGAPAPPPPALSASSGDLPSQDPTPGATSTPGASSGLPATRIIIPSIGVDSKIIETGIVFEEGEWQWERPKNAVGHLVGTGDPGQPGNIVMSGHISSPQRGEGEVFKRLPDIKLRDVVVLYTPARAFAYQVVGKKVVLPEEIGVLDPTPDETLTLITCVPDFIYSHRLIVTAKIVSAS